MQTGSLESKEGRREVLDLQLPEEPRHSSLPPLTSLEQMIRRSHQLRSWFPRGVPTAEERWRAKTTEEFKL
jgi:hypothetical protein